MLNEVVFPGLYCPGLIEARLRSWIMHRIVPVFPGLYCPGLIEAICHRG